MTSYELPFGIRNNNPGNLRGYVNVDYNDGYINGFAKYRTFGDGTKAMLTNMWHAYHHLKLHSIKDFVCHWAPPPENDVNLYMTDLWKCCGFTLPLRQGYDMRIDIRTLALSWAQGIAYVENGRPRIDWPTYPFWMSPIEMDKIARGLGYWP